MADMPLPAAVFDDLRRALADAGPEAAAERLITTLTDVFGFFSCLGLAKVFLRYLRQSG